MIEIALADAPAMSAARMRALTAAALVVSRLALHAWHRQVTDV